MTEGNFIPTVPMVLQNLPPVQMAGSLRSFSSDQLASMASGDANQLLYAYCNDCFSTRDIYTTRGDFVYWNGSEWVTATDRCKPTTSFPQFCLNLFIRNASSTVANNSSRFGAIISDGSFASGTGATNQSNAPFNDGRLSGIVASTGTTSTGTARRAGLGFDVDPASATSRAIGYVIGLNYIDRSAAPDTWHYRDTIETYQASATAALQVNMVSLLYDESDILGLGTTGTNFFALVRANGATIQFVDSGVAYNTPHCSIITLEPTAANTARMRVCTALSNGASFQTVVDETQALAASNVQSGTVLAKATGTNAKLASRLSNPLMVGHKMNTTASATLIQ